MLNWIIVMYKLLLKSKKTFLKNEHKKCLLYVIIWYLFLARI